jgi:hypothetical protein
MKKIPFLLIVTLICSNCAITQRYFIETEVKNNTLTIGNKSYSYDWIQKAAKNNDNVLLNKELPNSIHVKIEPPVPIENVYKKVFSSQRIAEMGTANLMVECLCNKTGKILETNFYLKESPLVTGEELSLLEDELKQYSFRLQGASDTQQYYKIYLPCKFDRIR